MSSEKKPVVLLIEANNSLRRLIALGLQARSMQVIEAASLASLPALDKDNQQPDLLVLDIDSEIYYDWSSLDAIQSHPHLCQLPTIVLTWEYQSFEALFPRSLSAMVTQSQIIYQAKPFDARILFATIEQVLNVQAAQQAAMEAQEEEALLAAYAIHAAPSIWPIITALGLLLAVIGLLFQIAVSVIGCLIVVVSLLVWVLRSEPAPDRVAVSSVM